MAYKKRKIIPVDVRFWSYVAKTDTCWLWVGKATTKGYGLLGRGRRGEGNILAHRFSFELHKGKIIDGLLVLHSCNNPKCVNPDHLSLGTHSDNLADAWVDGLRKKLKLTGEDASAIRVSYSKIGSTLHSVAKEFNVSHVTIASIINRKTWKHVP